MTVAEALLQIAKGNTTDARTLCEQIVDTSPLATHLANHLSQSSAEDPYTDPAAFELFISGGSNVNLYQSTIAALASLNETLRPATLIDIGCGDGRITAGTIPASCETVHLLEPSSALLSLAAAALEPLPAAVVTTQSSIQDYLSEHPNQSWGHAQATFALHNLDPGDRAATLAQLATRVNSLSAVEFDVPDFADQSPEHAAYAAATYEVGVAEYANEPTVVDGFLIPVLLGQFAPNRQRHTYEQSAASWQVDLADAGFGSIQATPICDYWWANAVLITANPELPMTDPSA